MGDSDSGPDARPVRRDDDEAAERSPAGRGKRRTWRPTIWLGTVSTVVAIATGMFTLRDQIFPQDAGTAAASVSAYQVSVGQICAALNQAETARAANAGNLARRLKTAHTVAEQRNDVLDSWNAVLQTSRYELGQFEGLATPEPDKAQQRSTAAAWHLIVTRISGFTVRLVSTKLSAPALEAAVSTLPAMRSALGTANVTRAAGLTQLGGGRCVLNPPINTDVITLPGTGPSVTPPGAVRSPSFVANKVSTTGNASQNVAPDGATESPSPNVVPEPRLSARLRP